MIRKIVLLFLTILTAQSEAEEIRYIGRSPKALFMGDAYTSIADDEYTLFYNPAGLARNETVDFSPLSADASVTNVYPDDMDRFKDIPSDTTGLVSRFLGLPLHGHIGYVPGIKIQNFGISGIYNYTVNIELNNAIHPTAKIDIRYDKGAIMGYAHEVRRNKYEKFAFGVGLKMIKREGLVKEFDVFGPTLLTLVNESGSDFSSIKHALGFSKGKGYGLDLGMLYRLETKLAEFAWGTSILDVGNTRFSLTSGTEPLPVQEMYVNTGISLSKEYSIMDIKLTADLHPLNVPMDFGRKMHFGLYLDMPIIKVLLGYNSGYLSAAMEFDIWIAKALVGMYQVELGSKYKQRKGSRGLLYLRFLEFLF